MKSISLLSFAVTALLLATSTPAFSNGGLPDDMPADCPNSNVNPCPDCPDGSGGGGPSGGGGSQPDTKPSVNTPSCLSAPCNSALREGLFGGPTKSIYKSPQNTPGYAFASSPDEGQMGKRMIRVIRQDAHLVGNGGMALQLTRIHNNINVNHGLNTDGQTGFGPRWYSNHDIRIGSYGGSTTSNIYLRRADGGMTVLYYVSPNKWETNPSQGETLYVDQVTTGYHMRTSDPGLWYEFNTDKQLTKIRFPNGNMLSYAYDGAVPSKLSTVSMDHETSDTDNRYLLFSYTTITYGSRTRDRISAVTIMPANTVAASYEYDSHGMLYRVKNKHGEVIEEYTNSNVSGLPLIAEIRAQNRTGGVSLQRKYTYQNQFEVFQVADGAQRVFIQNNYGAGTQFYALTTFQLTADGQSAKADGHSLNFARTPVYSSVQAPNSGPVVSQTSQHFRADTTWQAISDLPKELVGNNGTTTSFEYVNDNPTGNDFKRRLLKKKTTPDGHISQYEYDLNGRVTRSHDNRGFDSSQTYDTKGNVSSATDGATGLTAYYFYDVRGNKIKQDGPTSTTMLTWTYDGRGNLVKFTDMDQLETLNQYNAKDQLTTVASSGKTKSYIFDNRDRATTSVDSLGDNVYSVYDAKGYLISRKDELGKTTTYDYDTTGRLSQRTHADGSSQKFQYDFYDKLTTFTDELGYETGYEYDWQGRIVAVINPLGRRSSVIYENDSCSSCNNSKNDRVAQITNFTGQSTYDDYNASGQLVHKRFSGITEQVNYFYNTNGELEQVEDTRLPLSEFGSQSFYYAYDESGRLTTETYPDGSVLSWTYDNYGRMTTVCDPAGNVTTYTYTNTVGDKRLKSISHTKLGTQSFLHDANTGNLTSAEFANGLRTVFSFDGSDMFNFIAHADIHDNLVVSDSMARNAGGLPVVNDQLRGSSNIRYYSYDALNQLSGEFLKDKYTNDLVSSVLYKYDSSQNRIRKEEFDGLTTVTTESGFNAFNQLTSSTKTGMAGVKYYEYDMEGNLTTTTLGLNVEVTLHDRFSRLSRIDKGNQSMQFIYDYQGRMLMQTEPSAKKRKFYYSGLNPLIERTKSALAGSIWQDDKINLLSNDSHQNIIAQVNINYSDTLSTISAIETPRWFARDLYGKLAAIFNAEGEVVDFDNGGDAYSDGFIGTQNSFGILSADIHYRWKRWYSPEYGKWLQLEPTGIEAYNYYRYAYNSPTYFRDDDGQIVWAPLLMLGGKWGLVGMGGVGAAGMLSENAAKNAACEQARDNYDKWSTEGHLKRHKEHSTLEAKAKQEMDRVCSECASSMADTATQLNPQPGNATFLKPEPSKPSPSLPPVTSSPVRPIPHVEPEVNDNARNRIPLYPPWGR